MTGTEAQLRHHSHRPTSPWWMVAAFGLVLACAMSLRFGTPILSKPDTFDERYIRAPIDDLIRAGWSVRTAIDFTETKGPAMIWPYAAVGGFLGGSLNDLRLISVACFVLGAWPLLLLARRCGVSGVGLPVVAGLYVLLPQSAVLGQLLMSEPSFVLGSLCLMWTFVWGFGSSAADERRTLGPLLFGLLLAMLLHHRVHAVAFAAAACLVAAEGSRSRGRPWWWSWPWWLACALAGLSRVPLWLRWGGLVSPEYQGMHQLGSLHLDNLVYLAAAMAPFMLALIWPALRDRSCGRLRWLVAIGAMLGLALGVGFAPSLSGRVPLPQAVALDGSESALQFMGTIASIVRRLPESSGIRSVAMVMLATAGLASLGALAVLAWSRSVSEPLGAVGRLSTWSLVTGWAMYALISGFVFDRYMIPWAALLPIVWWRFLPGWLLIVQAIGLMGMLAWFTRAWLV